jgi:hypothetical protein
VATFQRIPVEEARKVVMAPRRLAQTEFRQYVRELNEDTAGRIELGEGERSISVRARLKAAAKEEGRELVIQRKDNAVVFWLKGPGDK